MLIVTKGTVRGLGLTPNSGIWALSIGWTIQRRRGRKEMGKGWLSGHQKALGELHQHSPISSTRLSGGPAEAGERAHAAFSVALCCSSHIALNIPIPRPFVQKSLSPAEVMMLTRVNGPSYSSR